MELRTKRVHHDVDCTRLSIDDEGADWVLDPRGLIKKVNLTFAAKFF